MLPPVREVLAHAHNRNCFRNSQQNLWEPEVQEEEVSRIRIKCSRKSCHCDMGQCMGTSTSAAAVLPEVPETEPSGVEPDGPPYVSRRRRGLEDRSRCESLDDSVDSSEVRRQHLEAAPEESEVSTIHTRRFSTQSNTKHHESFS